MKGSPTEAFEFEAVLERPAGTGTWTFLNIPLDIAKTFGSKGQVRVKGSIDGHPFRSSAMPRGDGSHYLVVNGAIREAIGATAGGRVRVVMARYTEARRALVPDDLGRALASREEAAAAFAKLSYSRQKEYVDWILAAKREETRQRRVASALDRLEQDKTLKG